MDILDKLERSRREFAEVQASPPLNLRGFVRNTPLPTDALAVVEECRRLREELTRISDVSKARNPKVTLAEITMMADQALNSGSAATEEE